MSLLGGFRADQCSSISWSLSENQIPRQRNAWSDRIKKIGHKVIPKAIDALALSDKSHTMVFVDILSSLVDDKSLELYKEGLADGNERVVSGTSWALSSSTELQRQRPARLSSTIRRSPSLR